MPANPNSQAEAMRALLVALTDWVTKGIAPPPSSYPRMADGQLVRPTARAMGFPAISGVPLPDNLINPFFDYDFGPGFDLKAGGTVVGWGDNTYGQTTIPSLAQTLLAPSGTVNPNVPGAYTYFYTNSLGVVLSTNRMVVVENQLILTPPAITNLSLISDSLSFDLIGASNQTVVVEACTNLAAPVWVPLQTNTLGSSPAPFSAPIQVQPPSRFYRLRLP